MPPPTASLKPNAIKKQDTASAGPKSAGSSQRPDQTSYNSEQDALNKEIEALRAESNQIKSRLALIHTPKAGADGKVADSDDRRSVVKKELDDIQNKRGSGKADRAKTLDAIKRHQDIVSTKSKEIQASRSKLPYRSGAEIDSRIADLNKQVESGRMKLIDEKKALNEISTLRRSLKSVAAIETQESQIAEEKQKIEELRAVLDDPEVKATQARWEELKAELDQINEERKRVYDERGSLFDKRNALQKQMDELYDRKRASTTKFRSENDAHRAAVEDARRVKNEQYKADRAKEDAARMDETVQRMREDAKIPAFDREIEDCGILIRWFENKYGSGASAGDEKEEAGLLQSLKSVIGGIKQLDLRKVDNQPVGEVLKKNQDEESSFFGGNGGKKKKQGGKKATPVASGRATPLTTGETDSVASSTNTNISLPFSTLNTLLGFGIPPPANKEEVPRVIEDLSHKKAWFEANQKTKTDEEIERVEKQISKLQKKNGGKGEAEVPKETGGEKEPVHTVAVAGDAAHDIEAEKGEQLPATPKEQPEAVEKVDQELEQVKSEEETA